MRRIERKFDDLKKSGEKALIIYLTAGDPSLEKTYEMILGLDKAGVDIVEIGVPFSDPTADGPIIQAASQRALKSGTTLPGILNLIGEVRKISEIPIVLFGYYNPVFIYGNQKFAKRAKEAGVDGILMVDLPPEEPSELRQYTDAQGIDFISLITPTSDNGRIKKILERASGFIYYVSVTGVTGTKKPEIADIRKDMERIKKMTSLPVSVGFGISTPEQVGEVSEYADGVVVGSAIVRLIEENSKRRDLVEKVFSFARELKKIPF
ncbi:MAG: tryptophan synthase subunit alpha [Thermodesulfobacteriota bacterium]|nr:tryptophan synthase subunit alpha [Thermodesulfobacteriota bacterium]